MEVICRLEKGYNIELYKDKGQMQTCSKMRTINKFLEIQDIFEK